MSDVGSERLISADRENDLGYPADGMRVYLSICKVGVLQLKAKFHYASWFGAGSERASVMEFGFKRVNGSSCFFRYDPLTEGKPPPGGQDVGLKKRLAAYLRF